MKDPIERQAVLDLTADYDLSMGQVVRGIHALPPAEPQYTELTPEEAASEIASGSIMSASYWLDAMIRLNQMGYAICRRVKDEK